MPTLEPFREKMLRGEVCFGTAISFTDPTITELLADELDFVWIDGEHAPLSIETVQLHLLATRGTQSFPLVRVAWNDAVLLKPVLDMGAPGVIIPLIRTAEDAALAVAACRYPPKGVRGMGPRRASRYGRDGGPDYVAQADSSIMINLQIEHVDAVKNLDAILATDGFSGIVIGPNDLAASMGYPGQHRHPEVLNVVENVAARARAAKKFVGLGSNADPEHMADWVRRGVQWLLVGADFVLLRMGTAQTIAAARALIGSARLD